MLAPIYSKIKIRKKGLITKKEVIQLFDKSSYEIIEFLSLKNQNYKTLFDKFAVYFKDLDLLNVVVKAKFLKELIDLEKFSKKVDKKAESLVKTFIFLEKLKILLLLINSLYANKKFNEIEYFFLFDEKIYEKIKFYYESKDIFNLILVLTKNKILAYRLADLFNKNKLEGVSATLINEQMKVLNKLIKQFNDFMVKDFVNLEINELKTKLNALNLKTSSFKIPFTKKINKKININDLIKKGLKSFDYSAIISYLLLLKRELFYLNALINSKLYSDRVDKETFLKAIEGV